MNSSELELHDEFPVKPGKPRSHWGLAAFGVTGAAVLGLCIGTAPFISPALRKFCLPYVPATDKQVRNIIAALPKKGAFADIGSGDGRIVIAAARHGLASTGYELNPWLVLYSKFKSYRLGLGASATFSRKDLWKTSFRQYDAVSIFGVEQMMPKLGEKLASELRPGTCVVACRFYFPGWRPIQTVGDGIDRVWVYSVPESYRHNTGFKKPEEGNMKV